jgi:hypothetical protein
VVLWDLIGVALVFLFHEILVELDFRGENDSFLFVEGLLVADVLEEMSFEYVFSGGTLFAFDVDLSESFALVLEVIKMYFAAFV